MAETLLDDWVRLSFPGWDFVVILSNLYMILVLGNMTDAAGIKYGNWCWRFIGLVDMFFFHLQGDNDGRSQALIAFPILYAFGRAVWKIVFTNYYNQGISVWRNIVVLILGFTGPISAATEGWPNKEHPSFRTPGFYFLHAWGHMALVGVASWAILLDQRNKRRLDVAVNDVAVPKPKVPGDAVVNVDLPREEADEDFGPAALRKRNFAQKRRVA